MPNFKLKKWKINTLVNACLNKINIYLALVVKKLVLKDLLVLLTLANFWYRFFNI